MYGRGRPGFSKDVSCTCICLQASCGPSVSAYCSS
jgi:hypothetical protein